MVLRPVETGVEIGGVTANATGQRRGYPRLPSLHGLNPDNSQCLLWGESEIDRVAPRSEHMASSQDAEVRERGGGGTGGTCLVDVSNHGAREMPLDPPILGEGRNRK